MIVWTEKTVPLAQLKPYERNPRIITKEAYDRLKAAIQGLGFHQRMVCQPPDEKGCFPIIGGHQRLKALSELGFKEIQILVPDRPLTTDEFRQLLIQDNLPFGQHNFDILAADFELEELLNWGMPEAWLIGKEEEEKKAEAGAESSASLSERFGIPPLSVFNAREGWWRARKSSWLNLGIDSEVGRNAPAGGTPDMSARAAGESGTSVFDPVLCEIAYRWFSPEGGVILDPFAGGSVRGIVAGALGRKYTGVDLRQEQVDANRAQADFIPTKEKPSWVVGDSQNIETLAQGVQADMIFSCPPYADLEIYSEDPRDLSTMGYADFVAAYRHIVAASCRMLKKDRFACFVVGEVRGKNKGGGYYNFVGDTVKAFLDAGLYYYNEAILVTMVGSAAMRAARQFTNSRKMCKVHQNVLVFCKGDPRKAVEAIGEVEFGQFDGGQQEQSSPPA